jgi:hypothetical protein
VEASYHGGEALLSGLEVLDPAAGHLIGVRRWLEGPRLERIEVTHLRPDNQRGKSK